MGYGRSLILLGETESDSKVFALRGGGGGGVGVTVSLPTDIAWKGNGREIILGYHGPRQRAKHLYYGFPNCSGTKELPR